jgi:hypothetical protein
MRTMRLADIVPDWVWLPEGATGRDGRLHDGPPFWKNPFGVYQHKGKSQTFNELDQFYRDLGL